MPLAIPYLRLSRGEVPGVSFFHDPSGSFMCSHGFFLASSRVVKRFSRAGRKVFPRGGYALGSYPCNKEKGETLVEL